MTNNEILANIIENIPKDIWDSLHGRYDVARYLRSLSELIPSAAVEEARAFAIFAHEKANGCSNREALRRTIEGVRAVAPTPQQQFALYEKPHQR